MKSNYFIHLNHFRSEGQSKHFNLFAENSEKENIIIFFLEKKKEEISRERHETEQRIHLLDQWV